MKKNKNLIILLIIAVIGIVGVTIAYFSSTTTFENEFNTKEYGTTYTESFVSPDNWLPGDTTEKTVTVTNSGQVDEAVRISLSEIWIPNNSNETLTGWIHADGTKSNHITENELATDERASIINFTDNSNWTKVGDYYYYNYKLAPGQTTDSLIKSVTFNTLTKLGDTCIPSTSNGTTTITCNSSGSDYDHATYKLTVNIETVQYDKYKDAWNTDVNIASMKPMNATQLALKSNPVSITNYIDGNIHEMYTFNHGATAQTPALTDYRYIGNDPYNYIYFNCDRLDNQNSETCEVWRIIGVFDVEREIDDDENPGEKKTITERRIKLVRGSALPNKFGWTNNEMDGRSSNDWLQSNLNGYLNEDYYYRNGVAVDYGLKLSTHNLIEETKFYLGGIVDDRNKQDIFGSADDIYNMERGNNVFNPETNDWLCGNAILDSGPCARRSINLIENIALLYPSDIYMTYKGIDATCYNNPYFCSNWGNASINRSWIYNDFINILENESTMWLLSPKADDYDHVFHTNPIYLSESSPTGLENIYPVLYLSSNVDIIDGDGSIGSPYKLSGN